MTRRSEPWGGDVGAATGFFIGLLGAGVLAGAVVLVWADASAQHTRAAVAADLAALAGADTARGIGEAGDPCAAAARAADGTGAELVSCTVLGGDGASIQVTVSARRTGGAASWIGLGRPRATSWAGPPP